MRQAFRIATLVSISTGLIYLLISRAGLTWADIVISIHKIPGWALALFVALSGANLALGARKWLIVLRTTAPGPESGPGLTEAMLTSALGELLGQVMPVQAGIAVARSLASHLNIGPSLRANLGTTLYEQLFDLIVVGIAAVAGVLGLVLHAGALGWVPFILIWALGSMVLSLKLPTMLAAQAYRVGRLLGKPGLISEIQNTSRSVSALSTVPAQLAVLSMVRYLTNLLRLVVLLGALGMWSQAIPAMIGLPLVQIIGVVPVTPGNLGVTEWTWSAVLVSSGATIGKAALFALAARVVNVVALSILVLIFLGYQIVQGTTMNWSWREK